MDDMMMIGDEMNGWHDEDDRGWNEWMTWCWYGMKWMDTISLKKTLNWMKFKMRKEKTNYQERKIKQKSKQKK